MWQCRACRRWRLDRNIKVHSRDLDMGAAGAKINYCYCADRPACLEIVEAQVEDFARKFRRAGGR